MTPAVIQRDHPAFGQLHSPTLGDLLFFYGGDDLPPTPCTYGAGTCNAYTDLWILNATEAALNTSTPWQALNPQGGSAPPLNTLPVYASLGNPSQANLPGSRRSAVIGNTVPFGSQFIDTAMLGMNSAGTKLYLVGGQTIPSSTSLTSADAFSVNITCGSIPQILPTTIPSTTTPLPCPFPLPLNAQCIGGSNVHRNLPLLKTNYCFSVR